MHALVMHMQLGAEVKVQKAKQDVMVQNGKLAQLMSR